MVKDIKTVEQFQILNINFFAYNKTDAVGLMKSIKNNFPNNHIYVIKENMRYYVRGIVFYTSLEQSHQSNQIIQLVNYYYCYSDDYAELDYKMAG
jgi:hypothetical protein